MKIKSQKVEKKAKNPKKVGQNPKSRTNPQKVGLRRTCTP